MPHPFERLHVYAMTAITTTNSGQYPSEQSHSIHQYSTVAQHTSRRVDNTPELLVPRLQYYQNHPMSYLRDPSRAISVECLNKSKTSTHIIAPPDSSNPRTADSPTGTRP
jgi:hypothetical protein